MPFKENHNLEICVKHNVAHARYSGTGITMLEENFRLLQRFSSYHIRVQELSTKSSKPSLSSHHRLFGPCWTTVHSVSFYSHNQGCSTNDVVYLYCYELHHPYPLWYMDSSTSNHMTCSRAIWTSLTTYDGPSEFTRLIEKSVVGEFLQILDRQCDSQ